MRLLFALIATLVLVGCKGGGSGQMAIDRLQPCKIDQGPADAYCGKLSVFENRKTKQGRKIDLKIVVMPALRRDPKEDPIFFFAGGPGQGAAKLAEMLGLMFRRFQNDRDLVMIDQRGTGDSNPLNCEMVEKGQEKDDMEEISNATSLARLRKCLAEYKADPSQYTTPVAMDDIDEVRQYLGYKQINLWGASYGTRAALVYMRQHPESVRTVVIDGVAPPDMRLPLYMTRDSQRSLNLLLEACEKDKSCQLKFPELTKTVRAVLDRADARVKIKITHPRTGERFEVPLSPDAIRSVIFSSLYAPSMAALLPRLLKDAAEGDFQGLFAMAFMGEGGSDSISQGMFLSVACAEDMPKITKDDIEKESARGFFGKTFFETRMKACEFWPKGEISEDYYQPVVSDKPVLVLSGEADPVTPPEWGERVQKHLKNSKHIVVPGAGHGVSSLGCVPKIMMKFLDEASVTGLDASCVSSQKRPPFFVNYSGPEAGK
jgi:pimeloyl-ACP methyl ester carboxylesterase